MSEPLLALIAAVAENGVVGRDNGLPWHLPADLKHFKRVTLGKPIIMGRRTFESIGRALPGRPNIVVSRQVDLGLEGADTVRDLEAALSLAADYARRDSVDEVLVIGGAGIYALAMARVQRMYLTEVHAQVTGDVYFPAWNRQDWIERSRERHPADTDNSLPFSFVVYERRGLR